MRQYVSHDGGPFYTEGAILHGPKRVKRPEKKVIVPIKPSIRQGVFHRMLEI
jgi:hypothetical protein